MTRKSTAYALCFATLLAIGCAKQPEPAPAVESAQEDDEMATQAAPAPEAVQKNPAEEAAKLLPYIDTRPECQKYRQAYEQIRDGGAATQSTEEIMAEAYQAKCTVSPAK